MSIVRDSNGTPIFGPMDSIALNMIEGVYVEHIFGHNDNISTKEQTLWTGTNSEYVWPGSACTMLAASANSQDSPVGTGLQKIQIEACASGYQSVTLVACLDGHNPVPLTDIFSGLGDPATFRVNRIFGVDINSATSERTNTGAIWIGTSFTAGVPVGKYGHISSDHNQSLHGFYTVPAEKRVLLKNINLSLGTGKEVVYEMYAREFGGVFNLKNHFPLYETANNDPQEPPDFYPEKTDIEWKGEATQTGGIDASVQFDLLVIEDSFFSATER